MFERSPTPELDPTVESGVEDLNRIRIDDFEDSTTGLNDENSANEDGTAIVSKKIFKKSAFLGIFEENKKIFLHNTVGTRNPDFGYPQHSSEIRVYA